MAKAGKKRRTSDPPSSDALVGFEEKLWQMADKLRNNMDAAEYKHVVLGLIFLKYISDAFEEKHAALAADKKSGADPAGAIAEPEHDLSLLAETQPVLLDLLEMMKAVDKTHYEALEKLVAPSEGLSSADLSVAHAVHTA
jgi:type I restriction-modification system DNA methylase subunit